MAIYDDLRTAYQQWSSQNRDFWFGSGRYASAFADGFRKYLGAPEFYTEGGEKRPYVELCKVTEDATGEPHFEPANDHHVMSPGKDESQLAFGITVILEQAPNTFPKGSFGFSIGMEPIAVDRCRLRISGEEFEIDMSDDKTRGPAYDHMAKVIREFLALKPWEANKKRPIGFVHAS